MIGTANYRTATEILAETRDLSFDALPPLLRMRADLDASNVNTQDRSRLQLRSLIESTYSHIVTKHVKPSRSILNAVRALNRHVLSKYEYETLDDFLSDQFLEVPLSFAVLSELAGFPVTEIGESSARFKDLDRTFANIQIAFNRIGWSNV